LGADILGADKEIFRAEAQDKGGVRINFFKGVKSYEDSENN